LDIYKPKIKDDVDLNKVYKIYESSTLYKQYVAESLSQNSNMKFLLN